MIMASELAEIIGGVIDGDAGRKICSLCPMDNPSVDCVVYIEKQKDADLFRAPGAVSVICSGKLKLDVHTLIRCENPKLAFLKAVKYFYPPEEFDGEIHPSAVIEEGAVVYPSASIGAGCYVGAGSMVGEKAVIRPGCFVGRNVVVGDGCVLHPNVTVLDRCELGKRVILHSGVVIGADGFGYVQDGVIHEKLPQVGNVVIGDDVEIGANSAVDRATLGSTRIGQGTKIDNLVQVGHNVKIGAYCIICGSVGISGSVEIGDGVILAGQVGVADHIKIGDGAIIGGKAGVIDDVPEKCFYSGFPARPHRKTMRIFSLMEKLPEMADALKKIQEQPERK